MKHPQMSHGGNFTDWMHEVNALRSLAVEINPDEENCITSMLQNPDSFMTRNAIDFLDMHFNFFTRYRDSDEIPEVPGTDRMLSVQYFLTWWRREWYEASESKNKWFNQMFGKSLNSRELIIRWGHLRRMRELLAEKLDIETLMFEYERAYLDQSVLRSVSPTHTACDSFDSSESSATPSPPHSPPSRWEDGVSEPFSSFFKSESADPRDLAVSSRFC